MNLRVMRAQDPTIGLRVMRNDPLLNLRVMRASAKNSQRLLRNDNNEYENNAKKRSRSQLDYEDETNCRSC